jgi:hypothetical protein
MGALPVARFDALMSPARNQNDDNCGDNRNSERKARGYGWREEPVNQVDAKALSNDFLALY